MRGQAAGRKLGLMHPAASSSVQTLTVPGKRVTACNSTHTMQLHLFPSCHRAAFVLSQHCQQHPPVQMSSRHAEKRNACVTDEATAS